MAQCRVWAKDWHPPIPYHQLQPPCRAGQKGLQAQLTRNTAAAWAILALPRQKEQGPEAEMAMQEQPFVRELKCFAMHCPEIACAHRAPMRQPEPACQAVSWEVWKWHGGSQVSLLCPKGVGCSGFSSCLAGQCTAMNQGCPSISACSGTYVSWFRTKQGSGDTAPRLPAAAAPVPLWQSFVLAFTCSWGSRGEFLIKQTVIGCS